MSAAVMYLNNNCPNFEVWTTKGNIKVDILMPNGLMISLNVEKEINLFSIKEDVFEEAQKLPLFGALRDKQNYIFTCVNSRTSQQEELINEEMRLCDIQPFLALFRLIEREGDTIDKQIDAEIGLLIGKNLREFDSLKNTEVNDFRSRMREYCEHVTREREAKTWIERMLYQYPIGIEPIDKVPKYIINKLNDGNIKVQLRFENTSSCQSVTVPYTIYPEQLIQIALTQDPEAYGCSNAYLLKIGGRQQFILGKYQLIQYKVICELIATDETIYLIAVVKASIELEEESIYADVELLPRLRTGSTFTLSGIHRKRLQSISSWTIDKKFSIRINSAQKIVNCPEGSKVAIVIGLFHGGDSLCDTQTTPSIAPVDGECVWECEITFDINVCDIPRMARLCFAMVASNKLKKGVKQTPLSWGNTNIYNFKNILKTDSITLSLWTCKNDTDDSENELLNPLGTVVPNPLVESATRLTLTFTKYCDGENPIVFPSLKEISNHTLSNVTGCNNTNESGNCGGDTETNSNKSRHSSKNFKHYLDQLKEICDRDLLHEIPEKDRELLWLLRQDCCILLPNSLSKLLISIKWTNHNEVAEVIALLLEWPKLEPEKALELLDYPYADSNVRQFAIECLKGITDDELLLYLLQLVQALRYESYLYCDLVLFLLERALNNQRIGHYLFWLLRSEMHDPSVSVSFGLILEAYCRGANDHMHILKRQMGALNTLKRINDIIRYDTNKIKESREKRIALLQDIIDQKYYREPLVNVLNPLDPYYKLGEIKISKCKFMDSKMKPLWLVFNNVDEGAKDNYLIFKDGDDLRQDMLTLQMIRIMDKLWKDEGLDLRMTPYQCISTDHNVGFIETVLNADTIANIQKEKASSVTAAFKKGSLLKWLKDHNPNEQSLAKAIEQFTLSCAGYCVATYVLGIADRHNDNIMVKKNGQLFHIDFGHILGKFKEKFGIRRERVPFVLTNDFVYVITHGQNPQKSHDFNQFQNYCENAFMILRKKGSFIISLFAMMLSTGIPELSSVNDIDYLRDTLVLDISEDDAIKHFRSKFTDALRNSWKTSLNWCAHNIAKDNKMTD